MISHNRDRNGKRLWTENSRGRSLILFQAPDDRAEALWIARRVLGLDSETTREGMAVLYRTNAQSRQFEEAFRRHRIPYQVVGAVQFYERKEVKDLLAYLKLLGNPADSVSFRRVLCAPPRGIGETTLKILVETAKARSISLKAAGVLALEQALVRQRPAAMLRAFLEFLDEHERLAAETPVAVLIEELIRTIQYEAYLERTYPGEAADRVENVRALVSAAVEFEKEIEEPTLLGFLDRSALTADADEVGAQPGVTLMTIHCAKGLEFPVVFLAGLEENLFPHSRSAVSAQDMEEERRLCYVAMTRAKERLFLSHAAVRLQQGVPVANA
ncbi:MAG: ATP-dependent helicase, partial [Vicinamibacteria bacterium]